MTPGRQALSQFPVGAVTPHSVSRLAASPVVRLQGDDSGINSEPMTPSMIAEFCQVSLIATDPVDKSIRRQNHNLNAQFIHSKNRSSSVFSTGSVLSVPHMKPTRAEELKV